MEQFGHTLSAKHLLAISLSLACFWFWLLFLGLTIEWWIPQPLAAFKSTRMTWCSQLGFGQPPGPHFLFFFGVQLSLYLGNNLKEEVKKKKKKSSSIWKFIHFLISLLTCIVHHMNEAEIIEQWIYATAGACLTAYY